MRTVDVRTAGVIRLLIVALFAAGACVPATQTTPARGAAPPAAAQPRVRTAVQLTAAQITSMAELLRMEDRRVLDTALVRRLLADPSPNVRARAVLAGGRSGDQNAAALVRSALTDPDTAVAASAAFALGELGDTSAIAVGELARIMMRPAGGSPAREAAHALGKLVRPAAYAALSLGLSSSQTTADVRPEVLLAIWHHPRDPRTVDLVLPFTSSRDPGTRFAATYALSRVPQPAGMPALLRLISDSVPLIRETAARGLRRAMVDSANVRAPARAALLAALADTSAHVRINAAATLAGYEDRSVTAAIGALLHDRDGNVRVASASALGVLGGDEAAAWLATAAGDTASALGIRAAALSALTRISPAQGVTLAQGWTRSPLWLERLYAVQALAQAPWPAVGADIVRLVRDGDPRVEAEALGAVTAANRADTTHTLDALYVESLASADPLVRAAAISALARHRDAVYVSAIMDAYDRARTDRENDAALAAVDALAGFARRDSAVARSFFFRFQRSPDPVVRQAVARGFGGFAQSWGTTPAAADRPLSYYEDAVRTFVAPVLAGAPRPRVGINTAGGTIVLELAAEDAPLTVNNFLSLIRSGYFATRELRWHRVVPNFVLQDGDPRGDGNGSPGYSIRDEINRLRYSRGAVGMALSGPDTGGSQYFITHTPTPHLDGGYTVFGYVVTGMSVADRVVQGDPINGIEIIR
jgi:cyclophilin family peptidyl-prolyl cis-trans isomerase/HEAT repeat protein